MFVLGGTTYEEARFVSHLNQIYPSVRVLLGSNFIHNNRRYRALMCRLVLSLGIIASLRKCLMSGSTVGRRSSHVQ